MRQPKARYDPTRALQPKTKRRAPAEQQQSEPESNVLAGLMATGGRKPDRAERSHTLVYFFKGLTGRSGVITTAGYAEGRNGLAVGGVDDDDLVHLFPPKWPSPSHSAWPAATEWSTGYPSTG